MSDQSESVDRSEPADRGDSTRSGEPTGGHRTDPSEPAGRGEPTGGEPTGRGTAVIVKDAISSLGGAFMISAEAKQAGQALALRGWEMYFAGRAGVLGNASPEAVAAALAYFPAEFVRSRWESARAVVTPAVAVARFAAACHSWARTRLGAFDEAARLAELLQAVEQAADPTGLPLFAGWRTVPVPADPPARAIHYAHLLREHRGGLHTVAVLANQLSPLQAIIAGPYGAENARFYQWAEPYPRLDEELRERRAKAEDLTDDLAAPAYGVLGPAAAGELVELLAQAQRAAFTREDVAR